MHNRTTHNYAHYLSLSDCTLYMYNVHVWWSPLFNDIMAAMVVYLTLLLYPIFGLAPPESSSEEASFLLIVYALYIVE